MAALKVKLLDQLVEQGQTSEEAEAAIPAQLT